MTNVQKSFKKEGFFFSFTKYGDVVATDKRKTVTESSNVIYLHVSTSDLGVS